MARKKHLIFEKYKTVKTNDKKGKIRRFGVVSFPACVCELNVKETKPPLVNRVLFIVFNVTCDAGLLGTHADIYTIV